MNVGQRAYLSIQKPKMIVDRIANNEIYWLEFIFNIDNQGNTPGTITQIHYRYEADVGDGMVSVDSLPMSLKDVLEVDDSTVEEVSAKSSGERHPHTVVVKCLSKPELRPKGREFLAAGSRAGNTNLPGCLSTKGGTPYHHVVLAAMDQL